MCGVSMYMCACVIAGVCASHTREGQKTTSGCGPCIYLVLGQSLGCLLCMSGYLDHKSSGILPSLPLQLLHLHQNARITAKCLCARLYPDSEDPSSTPCAYSVTVPFNGGHELTSPGQDYLRWVGL